MHKVRHGRKKNGKQGFNQNMVEAEKKEKKAGLIGFFLIAIHD